MKLLALDFDGVISDSAPEAFAVALRTWCVLQPESALREECERLGGPEAPDLEAVAAHPLYARFLEMMPLGNRAEDYAVELAAVEAGPAIEDQAAYDAFKAGVDADWLRRFHKEFYRVRRRMSDADAARWHGLIGPYPGVPELLRRRSGNVVLAIATSKDRHSVAKLLEAYGIADLFPEGSVLDKDTGVTKRAHFEHLEGRYGFDYPEMTFVDDKVNHLEDVATLGVQCALAGWGYNSEREAAIARAGGYRVLELDALEAALFG